MRERRVFGKSIKELGIEDMERLELVEKVERIIVNQEGGIEVYMKNGMWL